LGGYSKPQNSHQKQAKNGCLALAAERAQIVVAGEGEFPVAFRGILPDLVKVVNV